MINFELYNPTNLIFGKGQIEKLSTLVPQGAKIRVAASRSCGFSTLSLTNIDKI